MEENSVSLQDAFERFRLKRKEEIRRSKSAAKERKGQLVLKKLREQFLNQTRKYLGVPYAQRHLDPTHERYNAPLFLDCCGLIRKVLGDLKTEIGFKIGPWNQSYQYDTLPLSISKDEMKPGDLVFISGIYFNEKDYFLQTRTCSEDVLANIKQAKRILFCRRTDIADIRDVIFIAAKRHAHDMVHVEVWLGDGDKTIGARWRTGVVEIHDSYIFTSKNYHSMKYHFKSIDTWLNGICKSHCPEHPWQLSKYIDHCKHSIFASDSESEEENTSDYQTKEIYLTTPDLKLEDMESRNLPTQSASTKKKVEKRTFYIGGNNGVVLVEQPLLDMGMIRSNEKDKFFLKWVECKKHINYLLFKSGEQIVNHIQNINCITTKTGLLQTLKEHDRLTLKTTSPSKRERCLLMKEFFSETYMLNNADERLKFKRIFQAGELWISKPSGRNQGKGICLVDSLTHPVLKEYDKVSVSGIPRSEERIIQRYIMHPLLVNGKKFDIRAYMLIASSNPYLVFYHPGYIRLACEDYSLTKLDLHIHLNNQYVQKKHPSYAEKKEETVMSFEQLNEYINENIHTNDDSVAYNWFINHCKNAMKKIMAKCFEACQNKLLQKRGMFDLLGFDFMIDQEMKVWLIEININPALHTNCSVLKQVIPPMVKETLSIDTYFRNSNPEVVLK